MKIAEYINGKIVYRDMTEEEIAEMQKDTPTIPYEERVVNRIREKYSADDEFALQRKTTMAIYKGEPIPEEFEQYNAFVEQIKSEERTVGGTI